ncbi:hypothetical protein F4803DRAFT_409357 [Xylaria telfairii]|nr:hypothetical protein F4803DRAFT_409357 [Xylaria telfairii]
MATLEFQPGTGPELGKHQHDMMMAFLYWCAKVTICEMDLPNGIYSAMSCRRREPSRAAAVFPNATAVRAFLSAEQALRSWPCLALPCLALHPLGSLWCGSQSFGNATFLKRPALGLLHELLRRGCREKEVEWVGRAVAETRPAGWLVGWLVVCWMLIVVAPRVKGLRVR